MNSETGAITLVNTLSSQSDPAYVIQSLRGGFTEFMKLLNGLKKS